MTDITPTHEEAEHTHKATITLYSNGPADMVSIKVQWEPDIQGVDIKELGYLPAAYQFVEAYMLPAIEEGYMDWEVSPMMMLESPSERKN